MYDNRLTNPLSQYSHPSQPFINPRKTLDARSTPPQAIDILGVLNGDGRIARMPANRGAIPVSPQALTIATSSTPTSPTSSDTDSESSDDASLSPYSSAGEDCPDFCGGPKNSCRSWTRPASPFYYTDENGIFLMDDRHEFEERQKIGLEHTMRDLDGRLRRLTESMSPPRFLSRLDEFENSTPLSPRRKAHEPSEMLPASPTEELVEYSCMTTASSEPCFCAWDGTLRQLELCPTEKASLEPSHHAINIPENIETEIADLGKLIQTSLQHVQSTNSPPRYLTFLPDIEYLFREPIIIPNIHEELLDDASLMRHTSPQLHLGNTAYPTPLPSSPETKPSRKRVRGAHEGRQESGGGKRRRDEHDGRVSTYWKLRMA